MEEENRAPCSFKMERDRQPNSNIDIFSFPFQFHTRILNYILPFIADYKLPELKAQVKSKKNEKSLAYIQLKFEYIMLILKINWQDYFKREK